MKPRTLLTVVVKSHCDAIAWRRDRLGLSITDLGGGKRLIQAFGPVDPDPTARLLFAVTHEAADAIAEGADREAMLAALRGLLKRTLGPEI